MTTLSGLCSALLGVRTGKSESLEGRNALTHPCPEVREIKKEKKEKLTECHGLPTNAVQM